METHPAWVCICYALSSNSLCIFLDLQRHKSSKAIDQSDNTGVSILDRYCPIQERSKFASNRRHCRCLSDDAVDAKRIRQQLERKWKSTRKEVDHTAYRKACRFSNKLIVSSRQEFYRKRIRAAGIYPRTRWAALRDVLHLTDNTEILSELKCSYLCDSFATYFIGKKYEI